MNSGFTFGTGNPTQQPSFGSFLGTTGTTVNNPLGGSTLFSGSTVPTSTSAFQFGGATSTPSLFPSSTANMGTSSWLGQPTTSSAFGFSAAPSLFSGTNTTVATGTTPSTGLLSGFGATPSTLGLTAPTMGFPSAASTGVFGVLPATSSVSSLTLATGTTPSTGLLSGFGATPSTLGLTGSTMGFPSATSTGAFGVLPATSVPSLNFAPSMTTPVTTSATIGLGGVDYSQISTDTAGRSTSGKSDSKVLKETVLPDLIKADVDNFRNHVKQQKTIREEISRISSKPVYRVQEETAALKQLLSVASSGVQRNAVAIEKLKAESANELKNAEIAQRTKDYPPSMQYENTAPIKYFQEVVLGFEGHMQVYRKQIEDLEHHLASLSQSATLMPHELNVIMRRLHESFVALAAQLQLVHESVQTMKEDFSHFRRTILGDSRNVFEASKLTKNQNLFSNSMTAIGPTPFSSVPNTAAAAMLSALNRTQQPTGVNSTLAAGTSQLSGLGSTSLMSGGSFNRQPVPLGGFGISSFKPLGSTSTFSQPFLTSHNPTLGDGTYGVQNNSTFQLQKPPLGNKRGKRWTSS